MQQYRMKMGNVTIQCHNEQHATKLIIGNANIHSNNEHHTTMHFNN